MKWHIHFYELNAWRMSTEIHARKYVRFYHGINSIKCTKDCWLTMSSCSFPLKFRINVFRAKITTFIVTSLMFHFLFSNVHTAQWVYEKKNSISIALFDSPGSNDVQNWTILTQKSCSTAGPFRNGRTLSFAFGCSRCMLRILMRNGNNVSDQLHLYIPITYIYHEVISENFIPNNNLLILMSTELPSVIISTVMLWWL